MSYTPRKGLALYLTNINWLSGSGEDVKNVKYLHTDWRQTKSNQNGSLELSAQVSKNKKGYQVTNTNFYLIILTKAYSLIKINLVNSESTRLPFRGTDMTIFWTAHDDLKIGNNNQRTGGDIYITLNDNHTFDTMWPKPKRTFIMRPDKF